MLKRKLKLLKLAAVPESTQNSLILQKVSPTRRKPPKTTTKRKTRKNRAKSKTKSPKKTRSRTVSPPTAAESPALPKPVAQNQPLVAEAAVAAPLAHKSTQATIERTFRTTTRKITTLFKATIRKNQLLLLINKNMLNSSNRSRSSKNPRRIQAVMRGRTPASGTSIASYARMEAM